jgi:hypothetical protein
MTPIWRNYLKPGERKVVAAHDAQKPTIALIRKRCEQRAYRAQQKTNGKITGKQPAKRTE